MRPASAWAGPWSRLPDVGDARDDAFAAHRAGRWDAAESAYRQWLSTRPDDAAVGHALAVLLLQRERPAEALPLLERLASTPQPPAGTALLVATAWRALGDVPRGLAAIEPLLASQPRDAAAWTLAGSLRQMAGDAAGAEAALRRALQFDARHVEAMTWLAIALHRQRRWPEAIELQRRVLAVAPEDAGVRYNLALSLEQAGDWRAAVAELERVVAQRPARLDARARLAGLQALLCDFDGEARSVAVLEALLASPASLAPDDQLEPFVLTFLPLSTAAAANALRRHVGKVGREAASLRPIARPVRARDAGPLRLGYLSADFGDHAVGGLVRDHFAAHDRDRVRVHGYSLRRHAGPVAEAIRAGFDEFADLEASATADIAQRIADDGIDVLIDMSGYTLGARPAALALRPAPVQLGWLGFIHDYGAPWIDALLLDEHLAPAGTDAAFSTRVVRLPGSSLPAPRRSDFAPRSRAEFGLPPHGPLFASFNNSYKLDAELVRAWVAIAAQVPEAHFAVYVPEAARSGLDSAWRSAGGREGALVFVPKLEPAGHLARSAACDLFLDAFRYQAGATGIAALEAGLPVLCREGRNPLSRLGSSLDRSLGLEELVCPDSETYVERAVQFARSPDRLASVRARQARAIDTSGFFDPARTARAIEAILAVFR